MTIKVGVLSFHMIYLLAFHLLPNSTLMPIWGKNLCVLFYWAMREIFGVEKGKEKIKDR